MLPYEAWGKNTAEKESIVCDILAWEKCLAHLGTKRKLGLKLRVRKRITGSVRGEVRKPEHSGM